MWILQYIGENIIHLLVLISAIGLLILPLLHAIPFFVTYKTAAQYILIATLVFGVFVEGAMSNNTVHVVKELKQEVKDAKTETKLVEAVVENVQKTEEKVNEVRTKQETLIIKVPVYIKEKDNSGCNIPNSFVGLFDHSAQNTTPGVTDKIPEGSSDVTLSEMSQTIIRNNEQYYTLKSEFEGMRELYNQLRAKVNGDVEE